MVKKKVGKTVPVVPVQSAAVKFDKRWIILGGIILLFIIIAMVSALFAPVASEDDSFYYPLTASEEKAIEKLEVKEGIDEIAETEVVGVADAIVSLMPMVVFLAVFSVTVPIVVRIINEGL